MTVCLRCVVSGRVQGVFFRASAQREAQRLGLTGYAINLRNGDVEVLACGEQEAVNQMKNWLAIGPPSGKVTGVSCQPAEETPPGRFTTG